MCASIYTQQTEYNNSFQLCQEEINMLFSKRFTFERTDAFGMRFKHIYYDGKKARQSHRYYSSIVLLSKKITHLREEWQILGDCYEQIIDITNGKVIKTFC